MSCRTNWQDLNQRVKDSTTLYDWNCTFRVLLKLKQKWAIPYWVATAYRIIIVWLLFNIDWVLLQKFLSAFSNKAKSYLLNLYFFKCIFNFNYQPIVDGGLVDDPFLPEEPLELIKKGEKNYRDSLMFFLILFYNLKKHANEALFLFFRHSWAPHMTLPRNTKTFPISD